MRWLSRDSVILVVLVAILLASGSDLLGDVGQGVDRAHLVSEGVILVVSMLGIGWILLGIRRQAVEIARLQSELDEARTLAPSNDRLLDARRRLADVIAEQFTEWDLTPSEKEVAHLLLKGLSLKEIAMLRGTAEKTIRQQASSAYQKSGVSGRHAFAAWFIEDFL